MSQEGTAKRPTPREILDQRKRYDSSVKPDDGVRTLGEHNRGKTEDIFDCVEENFESGKQHFKSRDLDVSYSNKEIGSVLGAVDSAYRAVREEYKGAAGGYLPETIVWRKNKPKTWDSAPLFEYDGVMDEIEAFEYNGVRDAVEEKLFDG